MGGRREIEVWGDDTWTVKKYAWRSRCIKSPISGINMRAVVAVDEHGYHRPGVRNWEWYTPDRVHKTIYESYEKFQNKDDAISRAKSMLDETMARHRDDLDEMKSNEHLLRRMQSAARKYGFAFKVASTQLRRRSMDR